MSARYPRTSELLDRQGPGHPLLLVRIEGTIELVRAGLQVHADSRGPARLDDLTVLIDAVTLDRDPVLEARGGRIGHLNRNLPGLRGQRRLGELEGAVGIGAHLLCLPA